LKEAASWTAVAGICVGAIVYFDDLRRLTNHALGLPSPQEITEFAAVEKPSAAPSVQNNGTVEIPAGSNGHYQTEAEANGRPIQVLVDTGASMVALTYEDAETAGIYLKPSDFTHTVSTANGIGRVAPVMLDRVSIGSITVRNVEAAVSEPGRLTMSLLGMSFLGRLERVDMRSGVLVLHD
jgi:aspartyl protease family protein